MIVLFSIAASLDASFFVVSDFHLDLFYRSDYDQNFECHNVSFEGELETPTPSPDEKPDGRYGCDSPLSLMNSALSQMKSLDEDPEFILITGDFIAHWTSKILTPDQTYNESYNHEKVFETFSVISESFETYFPNTQVLPVIGNNDGFKDYEIPSDPEYLERLFSIWSDLPAEFEDEGYYSTSTRSGYTIIALNSDYFSTKLENKNYEAEKQLAWLDEKLTASRGHVILAMHIPPGQSVYLFGGPSWKEEYEKDFLTLIEEHSLKIDFIFAGHFHSGTIQLVPNLDLAIHVNPAISPVFGNNPGIRYYTVKSDCLDFEDYSFDISSEVYEWRLEFKYSDLFTGCSPENAYWMMVKDSDLLEEFMIHSYGFGNSEFGTEKLWEILFHVELEAESYEKGLKAMLCSMKYIDYLKFKNCMKKS